MEDYDEIAVSYFLQHQDRLFPQPVAETLEEAEEFLIDCMAVICKNFKEVKDYLEDAGTDIYGMSNEEIEEAQEVFALPDGRYLVVEA